MITKINEYKNKIKSGKLKLVNGLYTENFSDDMNDIDSDDMNDIDSDDMADIDSDDIDSNDITETENVVTLDVLKDTLMTKFNEIAETDDSIETPIMLSDEQLDIVYNTLIELGLITSETEDETEDEDDNEEDEDDNEEEVEEVEEGLLNFVKKKIGEDDDSINNRRETLIKKITPIVGKNFYGIIKGTKDVIEITNAEEAVDKLAKANNYNGNFLPKPVTIGDKTVFIYVPGSKGIQKLSSGGSSRGLGV